MMTVDRAETETRTASLPNGKFTVPADEYSEQWICAALLQRPELWPKLSVLEGEDFHSELYRVTYGAMRVAAGKGEPITVLSIKDNCPRVYLSEISGLHEIKIHPNDHDAQKAVRNLFRARFDRDVLLAGSNADRIREATEHFETRQKPADSKRARRLSELVRHEKDDPTELLQHRFLCQGGGGLLAAPSGVGKSSLSAQCAILWALGKSAFGITPARPLKSLIVQAENDEGDLTDMRDGVLAGLNLTPMQARQATDNVLTFDEDERTGGMFISQTVRPLLAEHRPDILWIDPVLAYLGGDCGKQEVVSAFLRNGINPLIHEFKCGCIIIHHTNKPRSGKEKAEWSGSDFAYLGSGSIEWANWARMVLALRSIGSHDVYELRAAKRGARLRWKDENGLPIYSKLIAHAKEPGAICWHDANLNDIPKVGRPKSHSDNDLWKLLPPEGLEVTEWRAKADKDLGISKPTFYRLKASLVEAGRVAESCTNGKWQPVTEYP